MYILTRKVKIYLFFMHTCMSLSVSCGLSVDRGTLRSSNCSVLAIWKCLRLRAPFSVWPECSLAVAPAQSSLAPGDTCSWLLASRCYSCCCRLPSCQGDGCTGVLLSSSWFYRSAPGFAHSSLHSIGNWAASPRCEYSHVSIGLKSLGSVCLLVQLTEAGCLQSKQLRFLLALLQWRHLHLAVGCNKYTTNKRVWCSYTNNFCSAILIRVPESPR